MTGIVQDAVRAHADVPMFPREEATNQREEILKVMKGIKHPHCLGDFGGAIRQHFQIVDSTQDQAKKFVNILPEHTWLILSAEEQTKGRGSHDRKWASPPQVNIYATFVLSFPSKAFDKLFFISQVASIAVTRTVQELGLHPQIRWPNDVLLNGKKVCGVLPENMMAGGCVDYSVLLVGIGLNVNMEESLCKSLDQPVTSLSVEANRAFDKEHVLSLLYQNLRTCIQQLIENGFSDFNAELNTMLAFLGETIIVDKDHGESREGTFIGIDDMGRMRLQISPNEEVSIQDGRIRKKM